MNIDDPTIESLQAMVSATREELDLAITSHELWKMAAYDEALRERMGVSYATNAFKVVRGALRRDVLLALMRIWDVQKDAIGLSRIANILSDKRVIEALAVARARSPHGYVKETMHAELTQRAAAAVEAIRKYYEGRDDGAVLEILRKWRDKHGAHRAAKEVAAADPADATDAEIEAFYQATITVAQGLMGVALATAYDPRQLADVYRHHAGFFWASVRGERTEGHPSYRAP